MTGIPIYNCNNNCSTGANALILAKQLIEAGNDCVLAVGFEKMERGSLGAKVRMNVHQLIISHSFHIDSKQAEYKTIFYYYRI